MKREHFMNTTTPSEISEKEGQARELSSEENAQGIKFEAVFVQSLLDSIQKDFPTFPPR